MSGIKVDRPKPAFILGFIIGLLAIGPVVLFALALAVTLVWNGLGVNEYVGLPNVQYAQALGAVVVAKLLTLSTPKLSVKGNE